MNTCKLTFVFFLFITAALLSAVTSCSGPGNNASESNANVKGIDKSYLDTTNKPGDDFYAYANNGWLQKTTIPPSEASWGTFNILRDEVYGKSKEILEAAAGNKNAAKGSNEQLIGDYYASGMDSTAIEKAGLDPLKEELAKINAVKDKKEFGALMGEMHKHFVFDMFSPEVGQDARKSDREVVILNQGGLGLPDRDYYTRQDDKSKMVREKYVAHINNVLKLMGEKEDMAKKDADAIMKLETLLATASWTAVENRDPIKTYNKKGLHDLEKMCPAFNWADYFDKAGIHIIDSLVISQPPFFTELNKTISSTSLDTWKIYFSYSLVDDMSPRLSSAFENEHFDFYDHTLNGIKQMKPRWKRIMMATDRALGDALGKIFVDKYFPAEAKQRVTEMVQNLIAAYKERIQTRDWMSDSTKKQAMAKLDKVMQKLGYPDKWRDYTGMDVSRDSYAKNVWNSSTFHWNYMINKLGKPVDRTEWGMSPPTINAYYNPSMNEIVFPAGIMQYPFFDINQDDAINYGAMGSVIGHELTHGFDDQGSQFDANGNMVKWWTKEDHEKFKAKTDMLANQFSSYVVMDTLHVNGRLTLGENIADLGGLTIAYYAYKKSQEGKKPTAIEGLSPEQRFFLGWARAWCVKYTPESLRKQVLTNPHSPGNFRVLGPLSNMKEFYDAFGVKEGDKMYRKPDERAVIW
ncbi:MAG: M13 family metallopeptidase [Bacteroidia bacterium]